MALRLVSISVFWGVLYHRVALLDRGIHQKAHSYTFFYQLHCPACSTVLI